MWLFQCFPLFTYQIYLKSMFSKLGKRMCFIQGDTKSIFSSLFLLFFCTGQCFQQVEKKDTSGFPWRKTCWILYVTLHHCLCTQNSANFRKQHFGIIFSNRTCPNKKIIYLFNLTLMYIFHFGLAFHSSCGTGAYCIRVLDQTVKKLTFFFP